MQGLLAMIRLRAEFLHVDQKYKAGVVYFSGQQNDQQLLEDRKLIDGCNTLTLELIFLNFLRTKKFRVQGIRASSRPRDPSQGFCRLYWWFRHKM